MRTKLSVIVISLLVVLTLAISSKLGLAGDPPKKAVNSTEISRMHNESASWGQQKETSWAPDNLTTDELNALKTLCQLGIGANGGTWKSERINAAISVLAFGTDLPDNFQATAYKTCMMQDSQ